MGQCTHDSDRRADLHGSLCFCWEGHMTAIGNNYVMELALCDEAGAPYDDPALWADSRFQRSESEAIDHLRASVDAADPGSVSDQRLVVAAVRAMRAAQAEASVLHAYWLEDAKTAGARIELLETALEDASRVFERAVQSTVSVETRREIMERDGGCCVACGGATKPQIDHVIPRHRGGTNEHDNLQVLCAACNNRKRAKTMRECERYDSEWIEDRRRAMKARNDGA